MNIDEPFSQYSHLPLPNDVLSLKGENFFELIRQSCGSALKDLMEILAIDTVQKLLALENDILSVFGKNYRELKQITDQVCLHLDDGSLLLKPGLRLYFDRLIESLNRCIGYDRVEQKASCSTEDILSSLKEFIEFNKPDEHVGSRNLSFLNSFLENVLNNVSRNKNNYRYNESRIQFAQALYVLGGRNAYELVRLNLPGSLPSVSTLDEFLEKSSIKIEEGRFQYDELHRQSTIFGYKIAVCS